VALPKLNSEGDVSPGVWALVQRLNAFGDAKQVILASMYRQLSGTPDFLRRIETALTPIAADGSLTRAIEANRAAAHEQARLIARAINASRPLLTTEIEKSVSAFVDHAIGKMVTICRAIRVARGIPSS
jgi:hypothetical protein